MTKWPIKQHFNSVNILRVDIHIFKVERKVGGKVGDKVGSKADGKVGGKVMWNGAIDNQTYRQMRIMGSVTIIF